jgi:hypothetical protein
MHAVLLHRAETETRVVAQASFEESETVTSGSAADLTAGWCLSLGKCISRLAEWSQSAISATP